MNLPPRSLKLDAIKTATTFGGLLACAELQANGLPHGILIHFALACADSRAIPVQVFKKKLPDYAGKLFRCFVTERV